VRRNVQIRAGSRPPATRPVDAGDWLGLTAASALLGVAPATLRRWSDAGMLPVYVTPGGHRRYSRGALERLLPDAAAPGAVRVDPARVVDAYRRSVHRLMAESPWADRLEDVHRSAGREHGRALTLALVGYLDAADRSQRELYLKEARVQAAAYGRLASSLGLSLSQTVEGFLRFRSPFLRALSAAARRRGADAAATTHVLDTAERAMDQVLVATMAGHGVASVGAPGSEPVETREMRETRETRETREMRETRETRETREMRETRETARA
jgi:hypothetical protein